MEEWLHHAGTNRHGFIEDDFTRFFLISYPSSDAHEPFGNRSSSVVIDNTHTLLLDQLVRGKIPPLQTSRHSEGLLSRRQFCHETETWESVDHAQCVPLIQASRCKQWINHKDRPSMLKLTVATSNEPTTINNLCYIRICDMNRYMIENKCRISYSLKPLMKWNDFTEKNSSSLLIPR